MIENLLCDYFQVICKNEDSADYVIGWYKKVSGCNIENLKIANFFSKNFKRNISVDNIYKEEIFSSNDDFLHYRISFPGISARKLWEYKHII